MGSIGSYKVLRETKEFSKIYNNGRKWHFGGAVIFYEADSKNRVGFTASKKVGNAVKRNRAKRRLRALFLEMQKELSFGSYIFVAKDKIENLDYKSLKSGLHWSFDKLNCLEK